MDVLNAGYCVFQPIVDLRNMRVKSNEMLFRSRALAGRSTLEYIKKLELERNITSLDQWMINSAIQELELSRLDMHFCLSVNVSAISVCDKRFNNHVRALFSGRNFGGRLQIEITETVELSHLGIARSFISFVKNSGCLVAMDDYGSGYATIDTVKRLDFDVVKIDKHLVRTFLTCKDSRNAINSLVSHKKDCEMAFIAEGVSSSIITSSLIELGIEMGQSNYFYEPRMSPIND